MKVSKQFNVVLFKGPLGIHLKACFGQHGAYVDSFYRSDEGEYLEVESTKLVCVGDILWNINGIGDVYQMNLDDIKKSLIGAAFPMELTFLRPTYNVAENFVDDFRNRSWIGKYIRDVRRTQEKEYIGFVRLHEYFTLAKSGFPSVPGKYATQGILFLLNLVDVNTSVENVSSIKSEEKERFEEILKKRYDRLLHHFLPSVLHDFQASAYSIQMKAYYFYRPTFHYIPIPDILTSYPHYLYLYGFLAKYKQ